MIDTLRKKKSVHASHSQIQDWMRSLQNPLPHSGIENILLNWTSLSWKLENQVPGSLKITESSSSSCLMILDSHFLQLPPPLKAIGCGWFCTSNQPPLSRPALEGTAAAVTPLYPWEEGQPKETEAPSSLLQLQVLGTGWGPRSVHPKPTSF